MGLVVDQPLPRAARHETRSRPEAALRAPCDRGGRRGSSALIDGDGYRRRTCRRARAVTRPTPPAGPKTDPRTWAGACPHGLAARHTAGADGDRDDVLLPVGRAYAVDRLDFGRTQAFTITSANRVRAADRAERNHDRPSPRLAAEQSPAGQIAVARRALVWDHGPHRPARGSRRAARTGRPPRRLREPLLLGGPAARAPLRWDCPDCVQRGDRRRAHRPRRDPPAGRPGGLLVAHQRHHILLLRRGSEQTAPPWRRSRARWPVSRSSSSLPPGGYRGSCTRPGSPWAERGRLLKAECSADGARGPARPAGRTRCVRRNGAPTFVDHQRPRRCPWSTRRPMTAAGWRSLSRAVGFLEELVLLADRAGVRVRADRAARPLRPASDGRRASYIGLPSSRSIRSRRSTHSPASTRPARRPTSSSPRSCGGSATGPGRLTRSPPTACSRSSASSTALLLHSASSGFAATPAARQAGSPILPVVLTLFGAIKQHAPAACYGSFYSQTLGLALALYTLTALGPRAAGGCSRSRSR